MARDTLERLEATIRSRRDATADRSYTRQLLDAGPARCAKKLGEEAVETVIAAVHQDDAALKAEAADLLYHLLVLLEVARREACRRLGDPRWADWHLWCRREGVTWVVIGVEASKRIEFVQDLLQAEAMRPDQIAGLQYSPYRHFTREEWARLRADTPMTLVPRDLESLSGLIEELSIAEVEEIYLPLSRLLNLYVAASQELHAVTSRFLGRKDGRVPFIIGCAGSVAVGKSTTARVLKALLARWPDHPRVDLITTDGFLLPNAELEARGIMHRKGFPESFDLTRLLNFLGDVKAGVDRVSAPVYSHFHYDIVPGQETVVEHPDILIVEGLNVLQPARLPKDGNRDPLRLGLLRFLDLHRRRSDRDRELVRHALHAPAQDGVPRPGRLLPPVCTTHR